MTFKRLHRLLLSLAINFTAFVVDAGESSPESIDTDFDGVIDPTELNEGTSPANLYDYEPRRLSDFSFDTALHLGNQNQVPLQNTGTSLVSSFGPLGRNGFEARSGTRLSYRVVEANHHKNLNLTRGTIKFWFKPNWNSGEVGHAFGSRLIEIGQFSATVRMSRVWAT